MQNKLITRKELIQLIYMPYNDIPKRIMDKIVKHMLLINEQDFMNEIEKLLPCRINRIIKNRYYLS